jgi:hypothetical protein
LAANARRNDDQGRRVRSAEVKQPGSGSEPGSLHDDEAHLADPPDSLDDACGDV